MHNHCQAFFAIPANTSMQQKLKCSCVLLTPNTRSTYACVHTPAPPLACWCSASSALPGRRHWQEWASSTACEPALRLQSSAEELGASKPFVPSSPAAQNKGCACRCVFGRRLFWEPPPELLLVLMLCDNNLSCLSLVYAGHEKALCATLGAGCQLGLVRRSLCAPQLHPPQPSCPCGLRRACTNSHSTGGSRDR